MRKRYISGITKKIYAQSKRNGNKLKINLKGGEENGGKRKTVGT